MPTAPAPAHRRSSGPELPYDEADFAPLTDEQEKAADRRWAERHASPTEVLRSHEREQRERARADMAAAGINPDTGKPSYPSKTAGGDASPRPRPRSTAAGSRRRPYAGAGKGLTQVPSQVGQILRGRLPATPAGAVLGMFGAAVFVNYVEGGWPQVRGWFGAKFLNKAYTPGQKSSTGSTAAKASTSSTSGLAPIVPLPQATTSSTTVVPPGAITV